MGAFSLRLNDSLNSVEILVLPGDLETRDNAKVRLLGDGSLELSIQMQPSAVYYQEMLKMQALAFNGTKNCKLSQDQLVCQIQSLADKVQIVNQEQVLAEREVSSKHRNWAEVV